MPLPNEGIDWDGLASQFPVERPQGAEFLDIPKAFGAGVGEGTAALGKGLQVAKQPIAQMAEQARNVPNAGPAGAYAGMATAGAGVGQLLDKVGSAIGDMFLDSMSEGGKAVHDTPLRENGHFTDTAKNPLNWPVLGANAIGQTAPIIVASAAGGAPMAAMAGFMQNDGNVSQSVHSAIQQADDNQLMQSPTFVNLFKNIDQDPQYANYSDLQKLDLAKKQLGDTIAMADLGDPKMLMANLVASYTGDAYLGQLFAGRILSSTFVKTLGKAIGRDGLVNGGFTGISRLVQNEGENQYAGAHIDPMQGVADDSLGGFAQGVAMAAIPAAVGHGREALNARAEKKLAAADGGNPETTTSETKDAVQDIQQGADDISKGADELKQDVQPESDTDLFTRGFAEPEENFRDGLSPQQKIEQERLAAGFNDREKLGGNGPDEFSDTPAYMRNGRFRGLINDDSEVQQHLGKIQNKEPSSPVSLVKEQAERGGAYRNVPTKNGNLEAHFDDQHDADLFENAHILNDHENNPDLDPEERTEINDWLDQISKGRSPYEKAQRKQMVLGYFKYVMDAAKHAKGGKFHAPSIEEYAEHVYAHNPAQIEDKDIIFADGPVRKEKPLKDEPQSGNPPEFSDGQRIRGQEFIPASREKPQAGGLRHVHTIDSEAQELFPALEDKNIIYANGPLHDFSTDEGQQGKEPEFDAGKTKGQRKLERVERVLGINKQKTIPDNSPKVGGYSIPRPVADIARSGNDSHLIVRKNGKPYPSEGLARLSKPYTEAKDEGLKPQVVPVDGGFAVEVPETVKKKEKPELSTPVKPSTVVDGLPIEIHPDDVPYKLAYDAFAGSSMSPDKRAVQQQQSYVDVIRSLHDDMKKLASSPENEKLIPRLLQGYRDGYLTRLKDYLSSRAGTMSTLVTGRAKFPTKRNEARLKREDVKHADLTEWDKQQRRMIQDALTHLPQEQETEKLRQQLAANEGALAKMQQVNSVLKKGDSVKTKLKDLGLTEQQIETIAAPRNGKIGFDDEDTGRVKDKIKKIRQQLGQLEPDKVDVPRADTQTTPAINITTPDEHSAFFQNVIDNPSSISAEQVKQALESTITNKPTILEAFNKLTKEQLLRYSNGYPDPRAKKAQMVENAYKSLLNNFRGMATSGSMIVSQHGKSVEQHAREDLAHLTQEQIQQYSDKVKASNEEHRQRIDAIKQAISEPKTLDDFKQLFHYRGKEAMTPEQSERYDQLLADAQLERQRKQAEQQQPMVKAGFQHGDELQINPISEGVNSKTGDKLYNVNLETRLGTDKFKEAASMARQLGGGYWRGNFYFPTEDKAQQFVSWLKGEDLDRSADVEAKAQRKQEAQISGLSGLAERLSQDADTRLSADRKTNTVKRATEAAHANRQAEKDLQTAETLRLIADGVEHGGAKYLAGLRHKTQLEVLQMVANRLVYNLPRDKVDDLSYTTANGQREWNDNVTAAQKAKYAHYPMLSWPAQTFESILKEMQATPGYKLAAVELGRAKPDSTHYIHLPESSKVNEKLHNFLTVKQPDRFGGTAQNYQRLQRMGITTRPLLRAALIELDGLNGKTQKAEPPKLKQLEQNLKMKVLANRNAFNDFFPTPESFADHVVEQANIQPGMDVLEPSAGNGVLADAARRAGGNVDTVELAADLREILKEKGHNVVGDDFDTFQPSKLYDRIVMNPPFSNDMDIQHVMKAYEYLKPGGKLSAIVSGMAGERSNKRNQAFREWLDELGADEEKLPSGLFKDSLNPTTIATKLISLSKPNEDVSYSKVERSPWSDEFPDIVLHGKLGDATKHPDYEAAKGGDDAAARRLVADIITKESVSNLRKMLDGRQAILAAVHAEEAVSRNAIPQAMADVLGHVLGMEVESHLVQSAKVGRTTQDGFGRLTNQPAFEGPVRNDLPYLLLDDTLTQGGTLANLKGYIESHGGRVLGASTLTGKRYSSKIALAAETLTKLHNHFKGTDLENWWKQQHGYGFDQLTESEANYLLRAADANKIRDRVLAARQDGTPSTQSGSPEGHGLIPPDISTLPPNDASQVGGVFVSGHRSGSPRSRIRSGAADYEPRGLIKKQVTDEANRFLKRWNGAGGLDIQVAQDMAEAAQLAGFKLPDSARVHAMHLPNSGRVILVADNLDSLSHVRAKLRHEILGHHALSEVVGPAEYEKLLQTVAKGQHSKSLKPYFDRVLQNYDAADPYKQVEEVISHVLEDGERGVLGRAWDRVSGAILQALRKSGFLSDENITAAEVRSMMAPVAMRLKKVGTWAEHEKSGTEQSPTFSLIGKDGLLAKPLPGETETEATRRRSVNFSRVLGDTFDEVRGLKPANIIGRLKSKASEFRPIMMALLTTRQMADVYGKVMKTDYAGDYQDYLTKMEADRNKIMHKAERQIDSQWSGLKRPESRALSDVMVDVTMYGVHPDKPLAEQSRFQSLKNEQTRLKAKAGRGQDVDGQQVRLVAVTNELNAMRGNYAELSQRYRDLSPAAKKLYHDTEDWYKNSFSDMKEALVQRINDIGGGEKAALISKIREQFERSLKNGPYFPLARFGKFVVIAKKEGDFIREHFESKYDAVKAAEEYRDEGYEAIQTVKSDVNGSNADSANSLGKSILALINEEGADGVLDKDKLNDQVWQMMLELMPDASYAKHAIRRHRTKGANRDARRAFADSAFHFAFHVSKIRFGHKMQALMDDMGNEIDAAGKGDFTGVSPENLEVAQQVLDEMKKRHEMTMNPTGSAWSGQASGLSYLWTMFANVSSAVVNMTQTALVALPQMASRYGWKNAMKALSQATIDYARSPDKRFSWLGKDAWISLSRNDRLPADERAMIQRLREDGVIEITQAAALAQHAETDSQSKVNLPRWMEHANTIGGQFFHNAEVFNREVTALAAYRLARDAGGGHIDPETAASIARKAVYDGHFDYTSSNRPRWMRKDWQKVIFQYKMFAQSMYYTLARSFAQSIKGETPEVRKQAAKEFMGYMLMHTLGAGVLGLPSAVTACFTLPAQAIHAVFSDDDQPWDPNVALQNWLHDEVGGFASTALTKGVFNALGIDIGSRIGLSDMLYRSAPDSLEGQDRYMYYLQEMLGPLIGGTFVNFFKGASQGMNGDWLRGIQTMAPAGIKNIVKSYREGTEGETTQSGEEVVPASDFNMFELGAQSLGFTPSRISQAYDSRTAVKNAQGELADQRSQLIQSYFSNVMSGSDNSGVLDQITDYNRSNPTNLISGDTLVRAIRQKQQARLRKERGLALSRKDEHLRALGRFGDYDPLL